MTSRAHRDSRTGHNQTRQRGVFFGLLVLVMVVSVSLIMPNVSSGQDEDTDIHLKKCKPPKPQKPPKPPISPNQQPECEDLYDPNGGLDVKIETLGNVKEMKPGETITLCCIAQDCDYHLEMCTFDHNKYWVSTSEGVQYHSLVDPSVFSFTWTSSEPTLIVQDPPVCADYTAPPIDDPGGNPFKKKKVTIWCMVDDPGTVAPEDPPKTAKFEITIKP